MARARPSHVGSFAMNCVTCVIANTNTRSKKSSSGPTRSSAALTCSGSSAASTASISVWSPGID